MIVDCWEFLLTFSALFYLLCSALVFLSSKKASHIGYSPSPDSFAAWPASVTTQQADCSCICPLLFQPRNPNKRGIPFNFDGCLEFAIRLASLSKQFHPVGRSATVAPTLLFDHLGLLNRLAGISPIKPSPTQQSYLLPHLLKAQALSLSLDLYNFPVKPKSWSYHRSRRSTPAALLTPPGTTTTRPNDRCCRAISSPRSASRPPPRPRPEPSRRKSTPTCLAQPLQAPEQVCLVPLPSRSPGAPLPLQTWDRAGYRWILSTPLLPPTGFIPAQPRSAA